MLRQDKESNNEIKKIRARIIEKALHEAQENTFVYTLPLVDMFKSSLETPCIRLLNSYMDKYLVSNGYKMYCGSTKLGTLYYDAGIHTTKEVEHLYKVVVDKYKLEKENNNHKSHVHVVQTI